MDFLTILKHLLAVVETVALIGALVFVTRAMHENKNKKRMQGKKGAKSCNEIEMTINTCKRNALIFFSIYLILNFIRRFSGVFN